MSLVGTKAFSCKVLTIVLHAFAEGRGRQFASAKLYWFFSVFDFFQPVLLHRFFSLPVKVWKKVKCQMMQESTDSLKLSVSFASYLEQSLHMIVDGSSIQMSFH